MTMSWLNTSNWYNCTACENCTCWNAMWNPSLWKKNDNHSVTECTKNETIYGVRHTFGRERVAGLIRPSPQRHLSCDTFATRHITRCHIFLLTHSSCGTIGTTHTMTPCSFVQWICCFSDIDHRIIFWRILRSWRSNYMRGILLFTKQLDEGVMWFDLRFVIQWLPSGNHAFRPGPVCTQG